jgi:acetylornithine deacetylase/succinyl-diaminopimelate desuccinylase-like protein
MTDPLQYARDHGQAYVAELFDFLRIPSISTQPDHAEDVAAAANWLAVAMRTAGLENVRVIPTQRHPLVYADWLHAGPERPTVLIYGHYDVQPVDPLELWTTPPFEPAVRDDYVYARGAADDKGQFYIHVKAVEALLQATGRLPVNVRFIVEGEEECGGASLHAYVASQPAEMRADAALVSDTAMLAGNIPAIVYGLRGNCYVLMDISGPGRDLHSGSYGGGINNPLNAMAHVIAKLKDERGHINIPGFYDRVRPLTLQERELLAQFPLEKDAWLRETGAPEPWGEPEYSLTERLGARPTLDVCGLIGGYTGPGGKTVLPSTVHAKISMRLVPDQDPEEIGRLFTGFVQAIVPPSVKVTFGQVSGSRPALVNIDTPAVKAAAAAYEGAFGRPPVYMREGGTIPVISQFQEYLGLESVLMGFGLPGDRIHAPDERFYLPNFHQGIQTSIRFLEAYGTSAGTAGRTW